MQFVNDDMDDLFRRAAEEYPLRTDGADWDKLANKMQAEAQNKAVPDKRGNRSKYLLLLVLIPLLLICTTYIKNNTPESIDAVNKETTGEQPASASQQETKHNIETVNNSELADELDKSNVEINPPGNVITGDMITTQDQIANNNTPAGNSGYKKLLTKRKTFGADGNFGSPANPEVNETIDFKENKIQTQQGQSEQTNKIADASQVVDQASANNSVTPNDNTTAKKVGDGMSKKDSAETASKAKEKKVKIRVPKFYFGLQAGPDFTMVKSSNVRGVGVSFGLLAGYKFNKKFSVETGIVWDHKKYQSEGKYFNTEKLNWPHVTVLDVSGYCNMYEIPLNFRYNVSSNAKRTLFVNAGLSSYLMKKENYDYDYSRYGVYQRGHKVYKNTTNDWLSVVHVSVGLQKRLGSIGDLRLEPYAKLPIDGVGLGSLPLRSTGVYLGITRPIR